MKKKLTLIFMVFLFSLILVLEAWPVFATEEVEAQTDMHSFIEYRDGVLYVFHISTGSPVSVHIPPELNATGQVVEGVWNKTNAIAKFSPVVSRDYNFHYNFQGKNGDLLSYELIIAYVVGKGEIIAKVGDKEQIISIDSVVNKKFNVQLPDFEIQYTEPYELTATGNIKINKISTTEVLEINEDRPSKIKELVKKGSVKEDTWQYGAEGRILDGTMTLRYKQGLYVGFTFPFCPGSAYGWLSRLPDPTVPGPESPPGEPGVQNPPPSRGNSAKAGYFAVPALLLALAHFLRRPVCVSVEPAPVGVKVFRDSRGPTKVKVSVVSGVRELASRGMEREESFVLPVPTGTGTVRVKVPLMFRNVAKQKKVIT